METRTYTCGHSAPVPRGMGRGAAREKRLAKFFGRRCFLCACARQAATAASLRAITGRGPDGKFVSRPYTAAEVTAYLAARPMRPY